MLLSVLKDTLKEKAMILEDVNKDDPPQIVIYGPAPTIVCKICRQEYVSRGKDDPGYCRECEEAMKEHNLSGGPLDGEVAK